MMEFDKMTAQFDEEEGIQGKGRAVRVVPLRLRLV